MTVRKVQEAYDLVAEEKRYPMRFQLARMFGRPMYLRHDRQPSWTGDIPIYVRWCDACERYSVSHPAGFAERIHCACCSDVQIVMTWLRFHEQVFPVIAPPLIVGAAYAAYRLWSASRGAG